MTLLTVRKATHEDTAALALAGAATFLDTYADRIDGADIVAHAANKHSMAYYAACLGDPDAHVWVAETQSKAVIGYLVLGRATLPLASPHPDDLEIVRIYVLSRFQKAGIGYRLMQHAFSEAARQGARQLVLGVYNGNEKALAFYARQGFTQIGTRTFSVGSALFNDFVLAKTL
jgi:ribosomal protein S18 acetylase RimI-like enzyme